MSILNFIQARISLGKNRNGVLLHTSMTLYYSKLRDIEPYHLETVKDPESSRFVRDIHSNRVEGISRTVPALPALKKYLSDSSNVWTPLWGKQISDEVEDAIKEFAESEGLGGGFYYYHVTTGKDGFVQTRADKALLTPLLHKHARCVLVNP